MQDAALDNLEGHIYVCVRDRLQLMARIVAEGVSGCMASFFMAERGFVIQIEIERMLATH